MGDMVITEVEETEKGWEEARVGLEDTMVMEGEGEGESMVAEMKELEKDSKVATVVIEEKVAFEDTENWAEKVE